MSSINTVVTFEADLTNNVEVSQNNSDWFPATFVVKITEPVSKPYIARRTDMGRSCLHNYAFMRANENIMVTYIDGKKYRLQAVK